VQTISENGGTPAPQPHFTAAVAANNGLPITPADYLQLQLHVAFDGTTTGKQSEPAATANMQGNTTYSRMSGSTWSNPHF